MKCELAELEKEGKILNHKNEGKIGESTKENRLCGEKDVENKHEKISNKVKWE